MHHEDTVVIGFLREYNLDHNMAAVIVENLPDLRPVPFNNVQKFVPHSKVVALGRDISGKLMTTSGVLIGESYNGYLMSSTCKFSEVHLFFYYCEVHACITTKIFNPFCFIPLRQ